MSDAIDRKLTEARARAVAEATTELEGVRCRLSGVSDDRGGVVLAQLLVARCIDDIIAAVLPRFSAKLPGQDRPWREAMLPDYHRLQLARVVTVDEFAPILNAVDVLRKIRNEFAHKADLNTLEELPSRFDDLMRQALSQLPGAVPVLPDAIMSQLFSDLLFGTLIELHLARSQLRHQVPTLSAVGEMLEEIRSKAAARFER